MQSYTVTFIRRVLFIIIIIRNEFDLGGNVALLLQDHSCRP